MPSASTTLRWCELLRAGGRVGGAVVEADGRRLDVRAKAVVNATGVWADEVRSLDEGHDPDSIRPAKGIHITVPWSMVRNDIAVVVPVPKDKRSVFVVPWPAVDGADPASPTSAPPTPTTTGRSTTRSAPPTTSRTCCGRSTTRPPRRSPRRTVVGTWAGLRPLVKADASGRTADLSRRHTVHHVRRPGMVTVTGGKLTTYREMAADTVDVVADQLDLPRSRRRSRTARHAPAWAPRGTEDGQPGAAGHLAGRYGGEARVVEAMIGRDPTLGEPLVPGLPYLRAEAVYAVRYEMARPSTTCSPAGPGRCCSAATPPPAPPRRGRRSSGPSSAGTRPSAAARWTRSAPQRPPAHAPGLPESLLPLA